MPKGIYSMPYPSNEPVRSYAPGSSERESLLNKYKEMYFQKPIHVPLYIGAEEIETEKKLKISPPHDHNHTLGHFYDYGGSIITDNDLNKRVIRLIESIWSDGMAGYWIGRSWKTLIISFFLILLLLIGLYETIKNIKFEKSLKLIFLCTLLYMLWIFLFQNIIYKSRHILPILLFIFLICFKVNSCIVIVIFPIFYEKVCKFF